MELLLPPWEDWPELYRNTDKTEATEIVIIDSQMNYRGKLDTYPGYPVPCATIINTGIKLKPNSNWQITFGVNDLFNKNPTLKIPLGNGEYCNPAYPLQGRTYYASVRYEF